MSTETLSGWEQAVARKLEAAEERKASAQRHVGENMGGVSRRWKEFGPLADRLVQTVIRPRVERLAAFFDNAELVPPEQSPRYHCVCHFRPTERFPAKVTLDLAAGTDGQAEYLLGLYELHIIPVYFHFEGQSQMAFPMDLVDEERLARWVEERLTHFVDTYLRLDELERYHREDLVTDPVCGMRLRKDYAAAQHDYEGRTYYFCVPDCRAKFLEDPHGVLSKGTTAPAAGE